ALTDFSQKVGAVAPGLNTTNNNKPFTTYNADNDTSAANCGAIYAQTPYWYGSCWSGSIWGGGEDEGDGYVNGAYWIGSAKEFATAGAGVGAGNGWMYVK